MNTLIITDLSRSEHLDRPTMSAVRGGWNVNRAAYSFGDTKYAGSRDTSISALQNLGQAQDVLTATANGSAFADCLHVDNRVAQSGTNTIERR